MSSGVWDLNTQPSTCGAKPLIGCATAAVVTLVSMLYAIKSRTAIMLKDRIFWLVCFEFFIPLENSYGDNIPEYAFDVVRLQVVVCT